MIQLKEYLIFYLKKNWIKSSCIFKIYEFFTFSINFLDFSKVILNKFNSNEKNGIISSTNVA